MPELRYAPDTHKVPFLDYYVPEYVEYGKIRLLLSEVIDYKFKRACAAEFIAMVFFIVICCGCAMVTLNLSNPNLMMVAVSFGFGILCLAQFVGPLSGQFSLDSNILMTLSSEIFIGGHINCAVSFALFVGGRISLFRCAAYTFSQMGGATLGAFFLWAIFGNHWPAARAFGSNSWDESVFAGGQVFLAEMMGTMILIYNVFATIDIPTVTTLFTESLKTLKVVTGWRWSSWSLSYCDVSDGSSFVPPTH